MGCEFEAIETTHDKHGATHTKAICLGNLMGCLVDDPMGWANCTRRAWLLMNQPALDVKDIPISKSRRKTTSALQGKLV